MIIVLYLIIAILVALLFYVLVIRPWQLTWGATKAEASQALIGDEIVQKPHFVATRAITIAAPPVEVWKWIIQIGSARAGWYSLDLIDNANKPSLIYDFGDIIMMSKCMKGIKARAEKQTERYDPIHA